jgi:hypothetical protein
MRGDFPALCPVPLHGTDRHANLYLPAEGTKPSRRLHDGAQILIREDTPRTPRMQKKQATLSTHGNVQGAGYLCMTRIEQGSRRGWVELAFLVGGKPPGSRRKTIPGFQAPSGRSGHLECQMPIYSNCAKAMRHSAKGSPTHQGRDAPKTRKRRIVINFVSTDAFRGLVIGPRITNFCASNPKPPPFKPRSSIFFSALECFLSSLYRYSHVGG